MGKKTSVYLSDSMIAQLEESGRSLPEVIRTGLGMTPLATASRADLHEVVREVLSQVSTMVLPPSVTPLDEAVSGKSRDLAQAAAPRPRVKLPGLDKRIRESTDALIEEWSATWGTLTPADELVAGVRAVIQGLLEQGIVPADIGRAVAQWHVMGGTDPQEIAVITHQLMEGDTESVRMVWDE